MFEPHTELIKRNKQPNPLQCGHKVLVIEDAVGIYLPLRSSGKWCAGCGVGRAVVMQKLQKQFNGKIERASFDGGFHSPGKPTGVGKDCGESVPGGEGEKQGREQQEEASAEFRARRGQRHPGVESAIGALQEGNGLNGVVLGASGGTSAYVGLGIMGRNLHVLGKLLIARGRWRLSSREKQTQSSRLTKQQ